MYQSPSQAIKQPLVSSTKSPSKTSTALLENFDESDLPRACDKFMLASIDITHLDGTFPASPDENSTGPLTVEIYSQAQTHPHQARLQQQVQLSQPKQTHQAALPVAMPGPQTPRQQQSQQPALQGKQAPLPVVQSAPQATGGPPTQTPPSDNAIVKRAQKAARERARIRDFGEKAPAPAVHAMTNRKRDQQEKFNLFLQTNGLDGQGFKAPTKATVKMWKEDPFVGLTSPFYIALVQQFQSKSGYENESQMYLDVQLFKKQRNINKRATMANNIYDKYLGAQASHEVFFSSEVKESILIDKDSPKPSLFNEVLKEVKYRIDLVHPRFIVTAPFKKLEELYD